MLRVAILGSALLLAVTGKAGTASAEPGEGEGVSQGKGSQAAPQSASDDGGEGAETPATKTRHSAKGVSIKKHGKFTGRVVSESALRKEPLGMPSGDLELRMLGLDESVKVNIYNEDGSYNVESLRSLDHVLRCRRTDDEKPIEPRLFTILSHVYDHFGGKPIDIVSGYRNQRKKTSNHYKGTATDIRIEGVTPKKIESFAESIDTGGLGIGLYPRGQFVHIDVRPLPSYRWIDMSSPNPNAAEKRPPRDWKRKKLQS
jgi:uncharacterized protein YcbK (DUF882 family)